jgi:hypothetical protein
MILFVLLMLYTVTSTFWQLFLVYILMFDLPQTRPLRKAIIHVAFLLLLMYLGKETLALIMCSWVVHKVTILNFAHEDVDPENKACDRSEGCTQDILNFACARMIFYIRFMCFIQGILSMIYILKFLVIGFTIYFLRNTCIHVLF